MQDAAIQHNAALAEDDTVPPDTGARATAPRGLLPYLQYGCSGVDNTLKEPNLQYRSSGVDSALKQHERYKPLPPAPELDAEVHVNDADLPGIPQRTPVWFAARAVCITASTASRFLGFKARPAARTLAAANLKVYVESGSAAILEACNALLAARAGNTPPPSLPSSGYAACSMAMGTYKEADVLLTYLDHLQALRM